MTENDGKKISADELINNLTKIILGPEQRNFISKYEPMTLYRIRKNVIANKHIRRQQQTLTEMFK